MPDPAPDGSEVYGGYVKDELDRQTDRKASFEQRGISVITSAGVIVTLLLALAGFSAGEQKSLALPGASKVLLILALVCFLLAIGFALAINAPRSYENVLPTQLHQAVKTRWADSPSAARRQVAYTQIKVLKSAREVNTDKAWLLFSAMIAELIAVLLLAAAIAVALIAPSAKAKAKAATTSPPPALTWRVTPGGNQLVTPSNGQPPPDVEVPRNESSATVTLSATDPGGMRRLQLWRHARYFCLGPSTTLVVYGDGYKLIRGTDLGSGVTSTHTLSLTDKISTSDFACPADMHPSKASVRLNGQAVDQPQGATSESIVVRMALLGRPAASTWRRAR
jgi:hypothetical protein